MQFAQRHLEVICMPLLQGKALLPVCILSFGTLETPPQLVALLPVKEIDSLADTMVYPEF